MSLVSKLAVTSILMLGVTPVFAADIDVTSKIDAVSVYPDGASVTRIIEFDAPAGDSVLVAKDLPRNIDPASIRIDAREAAGVAIASIDADSVLTGEPLPDAQTEKALLDLQDKRQGIAGAGEALKSKKGLMERFASSATFSTAKEGTDINALRAGWNALGDDLTQVNEAIRQNGLQLREIDEQITGLEARIEGRPEGKARTALRIALSSDQPAKGRIAVTYLVGNAGWTPLYDARLDSAAGNLEITRRAQIRQSTGEDWTDVAMTVSTARATSGAAVPKLDSKIIDFWKPPVVYEYAPPLAAAAPAPEPDELMRRKRPVEPVAPSAPPPKPGKEVEATVNTGGFQSVWALPARATIPSSNASKSLRLATFSLKPEIVARAAPSVQQTAYIEARFANADTTPLFPGTVSVYRDGLYAGQTQMPLATRDEPVRLGFGADDSIKVERVVTRILQTDTGQYNPRSSEQRNYKISLRNGRPTPISISIEEALPVSENKDIKIDLSPKSTPATTKNADDRRGIMVWTYDLPAGGTKNIDFGYKVTWPSNELLTLN